MTQGKTVSQFASLQSLESYIILSHVMLRKVITLYLLMLSYTLIEAGIV